MNIIPDTVVGAFAEGDILQVLLFAILFGGRRCRRWASADRAWSTVIELASAGALRHRRASSCARRPGRLRRHGLHHRQVRVGDPAVAGPV